MLLLLKLYWKEGLIALLLAITITYTYDKLVGIGYERAIQQHKEYVDEYNKKLDGRINNLEGFSSYLIKQNEVYNVKLNEDLNKILVASRKGPLVIQKEGKCTLSSNFIDSYNSVIDRANQK